MAYRSRPEHRAPPEIYYDEFQALKYSGNSRMYEIQRQMCERAMELLLLPENTSCFLLDLGCGSGLSGSVLEEHGHSWVGVDISTAMLDVALEREIEGNLILGDLGEGLPFKAGAFDGAISISALQWLCNADKINHVPSQRLYKFFSSLFACLSRKARAVFQFYPENSEQIDMISHQAMRAGFYGGIVVDYPNSSKAKKIFLVLMTGENYPLPRALGVEEADQLTNAQFVSRRLKFRKRNRKGLKSNREWILEKIERRRKQGKPVKEHTSKYTGRQRSGKF